MGELGKRKMNNMMSNETGIPYRDISAYGIYRKHGNAEELSIYPYKLFHMLGSNSATLYEPDFTGEYPEYSTREIEWKEEM